MNHRRGRDIAKWQPVSRPPLRILIRLTKSAGNGKPLVIRFQIVIGAELRVGRVLIMQALGGLRIFLLQFCLGHRIFTVFHGCVLQQV